MSNTSKMHYTNKRIKQFLESASFEHFYLFPHLKFKKDYELGDCKFDAFGFRKGIMWLFQFKTNRKAPKKVIEKYKDIEIKFNVRCAWINRTNGKIEYYITRPLNKLI